MSIGSSITRSHIRDKNVNLEKYPTIDKRYTIKENVHLTIGDLHGNALKLIYILIKHKIASNVSEDNFNHFVRLYKKDITQLTKDDLAWFDRFVANLKLKTKGMLRFIGDDLADRGANDYFTLKIFEKLYQSKVNVEVLLSNHTLEFIEAFECKNKYEPSIIVFLGQAASMTNLNQLIEQGFVNKKGINALFAQSYLPNLKALSYSIDEKEQCITLSTHAPIGLETVEALAKKLNVPFKDNSLQELAQTIDNINTKFTEEYVNQKKVHTLFDFASIKSGQIDPQTHPFEFITWNRDYDVIQRPDRHKGYNLKYIHGHDPRGANIEHKIYDLDNALGKSIHDPIGDYTVHYREGTQLMPRPKVEKMTQEVLDKAPEPKPESKSEPKPSPTPKTPGTSKWLSSAQNALGLSLLIISISAAMLIKQFVVASFASLIVPTLLGTFVLLFAKNMFSRVKAENIEKLAEAQAQKRLNRTKDDFLPRAYKMGKIASNDWFAYAKDFGRLTAWINWRTYHAGITKGQDAKEENSNYDMRRHRRSVH